MDKIFLRFLAVVGVLVMTSTVFAMELLTKEQALKQIFPDVDKIIEEKQAIAPAEEARIKDRLDGELVFHSKDSKSKEVEAKKEYTFYFGMKSGKKVGAAVIEEEPGKWGPVKFIIGVDLNGKVKDLAVMSYSEKRGRPIAMRSFLSQFIGKGSSDPIAVRKDIRGVTGATISSQCSAFAVKKAIVLYDELYLKK